MTREEHAHPGAWTELSSAAVVHGIRVTTAPPSRDAVPVMTWAQARDLAAELIPAATGDDPDARAVAVRRLEQLDGRSWLLLDEAARPAGHATARFPLNPAAGWPTDVVTSWHGDGHLRQRATRMLAGHEGRVAVSALAVRLLDHVPQVREEAWRALLPRLDAHHADAVLDVLLAGRERRRAPAAVDRVRDTLLDRHPASELVSSLLRSDRPGVRRWAFAFGHERGLLTAEQLLTAVHRDQDQWIRATCAEWLVEVTQPAGLRPLLTAKSVVARLVALTRVPDEALADDDLVRALADRSPAVREQAQWRARRRGIDAADRYRDRLRTPAPPVHALAGCLHGLVEVGGSADLPVFTACLGHPSARVRAAAVTGVGTFAARGEALALLEPMLLDPSPRVGTTAATTLVRLGAPRAATDAAWVSAQPWSRRAAWRVDRGRGSWDRVEADLRAADDDDPRLAALGLVGIRNWLVTKSATTWANLPDTQRRRIQQAVAAVALDDTTRRTLAFHVGIDRPPPPAPVRRDGPAPVAAPSRPARRWPRLLRRRPGKGRP
ncbi:HEAT repeat domain-containing protein [Streptomyces sp. NPDC002574]|uniref:HEAT repeat domain-containing protein n=1 Tax=Streptomyces sp. NPDC002574 TaxID=3364652 RepID=UPI003675E97B